MKKQSYEIGMVGLGVMGSNLLLNMADHGHPVAGYDKDITKVAALRQEAENRDIRGAADIKEFIGLLRRPRAVMMLVPAGAPVDSVINDLLGHSRRAISSLTAETPISKTSVPGGRFRSAGTRVDGFVGLPRCLSQRLAAGQSHPGTSRLFRSPHL
jgi:hypothetical protein